MTELEKHNAYNRKWNREHKNRVKKWRKRYHKSHKEEVKALLVRYYAKLKKDVFNAYGTQCALCGTTENLTLDHIYHDGGRERKELGRHSTGFYVHLRRLGFPQGRYRTLCQKC